MALIEHIQLWLIKPLRFVPAVMELLMEYKQSPSVALRNQLVALKRRGWCEKLPIELATSALNPTKDLEQIGYIGLIRAIERFDPSQGCAFSSFAVPYIRGEMLALSAGSRHGSKKFLAAGRTCKKKLRSCSQT